MTVTASEIKSEKLYTCGWCHRMHIEMNPDGTLNEHSIPGTVSTVCRGQETYNSNGKAK